MCPGPREARQQSWDSTARAALWEVTAPTKAVEAHGRVAQVTEVPSGSRGYLKAAAHLRCPCLDPGIVGPAPEVGSALGHREPRVSDQWGPGSGVHFISS